MLYNKRMPKYYKGYRVGSLEKLVLKVFLNVNTAKSLHIDNTFGIDNWSSIFKTARQKYEMNLVFKRLKNKGLIRLGNKSGEVFISLTPKGKIYLKENFLNIKFPDQSNEKWNGKWHIVIFDIPESRRKIRNILRFHLKRIGFLQVQASVWAYPFQCSELITLVKTYFGLSNEVLYIIADSIEGEISLKKKFKL